MAEANQHLVDVLKERGLSVEEFARVALVNTETVKDWLRGEHVPQRHHRKHVAEILVSDERELWPKN